MIESACRAFPRRGRGRPGALFPVRETRL